MSGEDKLIEYLKTREIVDSAKFQERMTNFTESVGRKMGELKKAIEDITDSFTKHETYQERSLDSILRAVDTNKKDISDLKKKISALGFLIWFVTLYSRSKVAFILLLLISLVVIRIVPWDLMLLKLLKNLTGVDLLQYWLGQ